MTPNWQKAEHLQSTRIRDSDRGELLLFKEVDWQTTRIEATAVEGENDEQFVGTPLRFIANQSKIRITMKKRLSGKYLHCIYFKAAHKKYRTAYGISPCKHVSFCNC